MAAGNYRLALARATTTIDALTTELRMRDEREKELIECSAILAKNCKRLSGTLKHGNGDFGVVDFEPDTHVDDELFHARPAMIIYRGIFLMNMAVQRLENIHVEADEGESACAGLIDSLDHIESVALQAQARRRALLITGINTTPDDFKHMNETDHEYAYEKSGLTLAELYEVSSMEVECGHEPGTTVSQRDIHHVVEKCSEKHRRLIT